MDVTTQVPTSWQPPVDVPDMAGVLAKAADVVESQGLCKGQLYDALDRTGRQRHTRGDDSSSQRVDTGVGSAEKEMRPVSRYWDVVPLTYGKGRLVWTDGIFVDDAY